MKVQIDTYQQFKETVQELFKKEGDTLIDPSPSQDTIWANEDCWIAHGKILTSHYYFKDKELVTARNIARANYKLEEEEVDIQTLRNNATWKTELKIACLLTGDDTENLSYSISQSLLDCKVNERVIAFTAWSNEFVYFPAKYSEGDYCDTYVGFVSRHPNNIGVSLVGEGY